MSGDGWSESLFRCLGEGRYRLTFAGPGIEFDVDRLRRERHELIGELAVSCGIVGARVVDGCLSAGSFNLSSPRARQERAKQLIERSRTSKLDWAGMLEELCQRVIGAEREGQPAKLLHTFDKPNAADAFEIDGVGLLKMHPVILFGDGATAKSLLSLYFAGHLAQRGINVLYADWELNGETHRDRLEQLFGSDMPRVFYARCDRPMTVESERLRRLVQQHEIGYVICDSVAFAADGPPESAEVAAGYARAVRQLGVGSLHVAHTTKPKMTDTGETRAADQKPFGSVFWHNAARATWYVKLAETTAGPDRITVGLYNRKANLGPLKQAVGFEVTFRPGQAIVKRVNVADIEELAGSLPFWQRIRPLLTSGARTIAEIAEELGAKPNSIERAVKRSGAFRRIPGADGVHRWGLAERRAALSDNCP